MPLLEQYVPSQCAENRYLAHTDIKHIGCYSCTPTYQSPPRAMVAKATTATRIWTAQLHLGMLRPAGCCKSHASVTDGVLAAVAQQGWAERKAAFPSG